MPAAAVTPAPIAYIKVVAVKKLVVGYLTITPDLCSSEHVCRLLLLSFFQMAFLDFRVWECNIWIIYFEKIRVFKADIFCL